MITQEDFYLQAGKRHANGESWKNLIEDYYKIFHQILTVEAIRKRVKRVCKRNGVESNAPVQQSQNNQNFKDFLDIDLDIISKLSNTMQYINKEEYKTITKFVTRHTNALKELFKLMHLITFY